MPPIETAGRTPAAQLCPKRHNCYPRQPPQRWPKTFRADVSPMIETAAIAM